MLEQAARSVSEVRAVAGQCNLCAAVGEGVVVIVSWRCTWGGNWSRLTVIVPRVSLGGQSVCMGSMDHVKLPIWCAMRRPVMWRRCKRSKSRPAGGFARSTIRASPDRGDPPYQAEGLTRAATEQRAWVAIDDLGAVIGFAVAWVIDGEGHLDELAVARAHGRRGVGRALVDEVLAWTAARGLPSVTLITFRDVPWNGPYYEKLGFEAVTALTPELQAALDQSATWGSSAIQSCADRSGR